MNKTHAILITLFFLSYQAKSQTAEEIGSSIFESLKTNQKLFEKYLLDSSSISLQINKELKNSHLDSSVNKENLGKALYNLISPKFKNEFNDNWENVLASKLSCGLKPDQFKLVKEKKTPTSEPNEFTYLLQFTIPKAAIRFDILTINNHFYLTFIEGEFVLPNDKDEYTCSCNCENGKIKQVICNE